MNSDLHMYEYACVDVDVDVDVDGHTCMHVCACIQTYKSTAPYMTFRMYNMA